MTRQQAATEEVHAQQFSYWPIILAAAVSLIFVGVIVNLVVTAIGVVIAVVAMVGWALQGFQAAPEEPRVRAEKVHLPARGEGAAAIEAPVEIRRDASWWGLVWFIATEAVFFANLIAGYLYLRASSTTWPPVGTPQPELLFPIVNTIILLLSGVPAYFAQRAIKRGNFRGLQIGLVLAAVMGAIFLAGQGYEYMILGLAFGDNTFATGFFVLTGFHGLHVIVGIGLLITVTIFSMRGGYSARNAFPVEVASTYWHFVDVVWIFLFTTLYLAR
ncbi:MAG: heme-copper oxidase subunit III [Chloroflexota bacterium]|nr:MAG: heme-copper oxidase subunit III [Chloroflexota bacterium]